MSPSLSLSLSLTRPQKTHSSPRGHHPYLPLLPIPIPVAGGAHLLPYVPHQLSHVRPTRNPTNYFPFDSLSLSLSHTNISSCVWCSVWLCMVQQIKVRERKHPIQLERERGKSSKAKTHFLEGMFSLWTLSKKFGLSTALFYPIIFLHQHTINHLMFVCVCRDNFLRASLITKLWGSESVWRHLSQISSSDDQRRRRRLVNRVILPDSRPIKTTDGLSPNMKKKWSKR